MVQTCKLIRLGFVECFAAVNINSSNFTFHAIFSISSSKILRLQELESLNKMFACKHVSFEQICVSASVQAILCACACVQIQLINSLYIHICIKTCSHMRAYFYMCVHT